MRIAHITDFHYSKKSDYWNFDALFSALLTGLERDHAQKKIDLIFITGDLVDKGGISFGNDDCYSVTQAKILEILASRLGLTNDKIVIIPGNHDKQQTGLPPFYLKGIRADLNITNVNEIVEKNTREYVEPNLQDLSRFKKFEQSYYGQKTDKDSVIELSNFESCFIFKFGEAKIGVAGFNSAWSCHTDLDSEENIKKYKLAFGTLQIKRAAKLFENKTDFNIALIHHPLNMNFFSEEEEREMKDDFYHSNFSIIFCGHTHKAYDTNTNAPFENYYLVVTKATFSDPHIDIEKYKSGYSLIDISYSSSQEVAITRHYRKYISSRGFDFDVEEAFQGNHSKKITPKFIGPNFISFLKKQDPLLDPQRKLLYEAVRSVSQEYLNSKFIEVTDLALQKLINRFLPTTNQFNHIRKNLKVHWEIIQVDDNHFQINERQQFDIVSNKEEIKFSAYTYIDKLLDNKDLSNIEVKSFLIDDQDYSEQFVSETQSLKKEGVFGKERQGLRFSTMLKGKEIYKINRFQESINSLQFNKIWKLNFRNIYENYEILIENNDKNYQIEFFDIGNNTNYSNMAENGSLIDKPITIKIEGLLVPGDMFWLFINPYYLYN